MNGPTTRNKRGRSDAQIGEVESSIATSNAVSDVVQCTSCNESYQKRYYSSHLLSKKHKMNNIVNFEKDIKILQSAFRNRFSANRIFSNIECIIPESFLIVLRIK